MAERNFLEKNKYNIERVEFYYNGDTEQFNQFLSATIQDYICESKLSPDCDLIDNSA